MSIYEYGLLGVLAFAIVFTIVEGVKVRKGLPSDYYDDDKEIKK